MTRHHRRHTDGQIQVLMRHSVAVYGHPVIPSQNVTREKNCCLPFVVRAVQLDTTQQSSLSDTYKFNLVTDKRISSAPQIITSDMCSDLVTAAQVYALYSATGVLFMSFVGTLLIKQPFFVLGIKDVEKAKHNAFGAAALFLITFIICIVYLIKEGRQRTSYIVRRGQLNSSATEAIQMITGSRRYGQQANRFGEYSTVSFSDDAVVNDDENNELHYA